MPALYRIDYADGETIELSPLARHMTTIRAAAKQRAAEDGRAILITRIGKAGHTRPCSVIMPDGSAHIPGGMRGEPCVASEGRTCFCRACRARRRPA